MRRVYLDNNATSPVLPEVMEAVRPYFAENFGNASSIHSFGQQTRSAVERARESVARLLNCRAAEVVFTSGGTEADNLALFGIAQPGDHVITSAIEHHAVLHACDALKASGCELTVLPVDGNGLVDPEDLRRALRPNTMIISIMMANNETGVIEPLAEIGKIAAEADVFFHTDAVQAAGKIQVDVEAIGCDLLSISGHKIHAPQGSGALYVRKGTQLKPMLHGGTHERSRRAGTENVPGIVGLGKAAEIARAGFENGEVERLRRLRDKLEVGLLERVEESGVNSAGAPRVPTTSNMHFDHVEGEALVIALDLKGLAVSAGAACSSGAVDPSHVLTALGISREQARASLRMSLGKQNAEADVDYALELIPQTVARLRELSPVFKKQRAPVAN